MSDINAMQWPGWETVRMIGRGGFGAVYEIQRNIFGDVEKAALKVITIPQNAGDIEELYSDGYDDESITNTFQSHLKSIVAEYSLMRKLNGCSNIVSCDDIRYVQHDDGIGWDIFIKMELLTPLTKALPADISEETVIRIAKDLCAALELCNKHGIIHRDIKPQNIFVSPNGDYKLGDFGIAKAVEKTMGGTKIGTYKYMAPEVYNNQPYGHTADIYSLGLVLYWLLNERRMPFLPLPPAKLSAGMDEQARVRRLSGEKLPLPVHGSEKLKRVVLKACAYDPKERYQSAREMLDDLNTFSLGAAAVTAPTVESESMDVDSWDADMTMVLEDEPDSVFGLTNTGSASNDPTMLTEQSEQEHIAADTEHPVSTHPSKTGAAIRGKKKTLILLTATVVALALIVSAVLLFLKPAEDIPQRINPYENTVLRLGGYSQFHTAFLIADELKDVLGIEKFSTVVITGGTSNVDALEGFYFADALSGAYLANMNQAPILLSCNDGFNPKYVELYNTMLVEYINANLESGGKVYILGDREMIPSSIDEGLAGYRVVRLTGNTCYETNLAVLKEAGITADQEILVCNGTGFAGAVASSATGLPVLLVDGDSGKLTAEQAEFLASLSNSYCIVGGSDSISTAIENEISQYGNTTRLSGENRFEISLQVAERYFDKPSCALLAYPWNYADGLCCSTLAYAASAPVIFADANDFAYAVEFTHGADITVGVVLGTEELIPDEVVRSVFAMDASAPIIQTIHNSGSAEPGGANTPEMGVPGGAIYYNGHAYYLFDDETIATWEDAQAYCESLGGYLAVISSEAENKILYAYTQALEYDLVYFGYSDARNEGEWVWVDQEESDYTNWHPGQPNDGENGNYAQFVSVFSDGPGNGEWSDAYFDGTLSHVFICEWPAVMGEE